MTKEQTKEAIKVMQAYIDGKDIEWKDSNNRWDILKDGSFPSWDWYGCNYRIKPEPKYQPFKTADEVMGAIDKHGDWVLDGNTYRRIDKVTDLGGGVAITLSGCKEWGVNELPRIEHLSFMDGTPFGMLEE